MVGQKSMLPISYRFKGGSTGLRSFLTRNIIFPSSEAEKGIICNSITRISVNPDGEINNITFINPIDSLIDHEVLRVLNLSDDQWKKCDTVDHDQVFYIQIAFTASGYLPNLYEPDQFKFMKLFPEPVIISLRDKLLPGLSDTEDSKIPFVKNETIAGNMNSLLEKGKYEEALPLLNELIKRDPFNRDLYKVRIMINVRLDNKEPALQDDNKIFDFAEGYSLDELYRGQ